MEIFPGSRLAILVIYAFYGAVVMAQVYRYRRLDSQRAPADEG
jgi:hypothetical protein